MPPSTRKWGRTIAVRRALPPSAILPLAIPKTATLPPTSMASTTPKFRTAAYNRGAVRRETREAEAGATVGPRWGMSPPRNSVRAQTLSGLFRPSIVFLGSALAVLFPAGLLPRGRRNRSDAFHFGLGSGAPDVRRARPIAPAFNLFRPAPTTTVGTSSRDLGSRF
jgi:hypothetical protein